MSAPNLGSIVDNFPGSQSYTVRRAGPAGYDAAGRYVPGSVAEFTIRGFVRPASGKVLERLPEGFRASDPVVLHTSSKLEGIREESGEMPDKLVLGGREYQVFEVREAAAFGFYRYALLSVEVSGGAGGGGPVAPPAPILASSVVVSPTAELLSTDVQAALEELQGELLALSFTASEIASTPVGGLLATDVQAALEELDSELAAAAGNLLAHTSSAAGVHGVVGAVVGTTDAQTLSNKTHAGKLTLMGVAAGQVALEVPLDASLLLRSVGGDAQLVASNAYLNSDRNFSAPLLRTTGGVVASGTPYPLQLYGSSSNSATARAVQVIATTPLTAAGAKVLAVINGSEVFSLDKDGRRGHAYADLSGTPGDVNATTVTGKAAVAAGLSKCRVSHPLVSAATPVHISPYGIPQPGLTWGVVPGAGYFDLWLSDNTPAPWVFGWEVLGG